MIISTDRRKIVLNLHNPERVTHVIPSAKILAYKGRDLVAIPHKIEETQVLRNLGFKVPSPVEYHYAWSGQYTPFKAQLETTAFLTLHNRAFCLSAMGTGKSISTLWAYDYLKSVGSVRKMLVVSPLSTLETTWANEIFRHFPDLTSSVIYGSKERRIKMLNADADIYLINHDGIKVMEKEIIARTDIDVVVIDEIASFRNASTDRWKAMHRVIAGRKRVWGLTGTPTPNQPTDAWAQCRLLVPERVPKHAGAFRDLTMRQLSQFKWIARDSATDTVASAMQPSIRFSREQCIDLPPCLYTTRQAEMSPEQKKAYREMVISLSTELMYGQKNQSVLAVNEAIKVQKLVQIASGVVYARDGTHVEVPSQSRVDEVVDIVEQAGSKVIVFVPYKGVLSFVARELAKRYTVETLNGETSKAERDRIFKAFQHTSEPRVLVAQPAAMSHGLTLTSASVIVWYAPVTSQETYSQANARITRPGQKLSQLIVHIQGSPIERKLYQRLQDKKTSEGLLLDMIRDQEDI